jgi:hypothetical protein
MNRIRNTIELAKASWRVIEADKELLLLPVFSGIASIVVAASFIVPFLLTSLEGADLESPGAVSYVVMFVIYVILAFVTIFFNAALIHGANERLSGGDPTVRSALRGAWSRVDRILPWALVSATVSVILQAIRERAGFIGKLAASFAGLAWSLVTYLVLPILVIEGIGVGDAVRRSGTLFKRTWGENVAAQMGFGLLGFLAALLVVPVIAVTAAIGGVVFIVGLMSAVVWLLFLGVVLSALSGVFQTALYRYAAGDSTDGYVANDRLAAAFRSR